MAITVAIVDDDVAYSEGVQLLLRDSGRFECVAACGTAEEALQCLPTLKPRIVLMDIQLPGISGPDCVSQLRDNLPDTEILMLTVFEEYDCIYESLKAGATGYLLKRTPPAELLDAIEELHNGGSPMSNSIARKVLLAFREDQPRPSASATLLTSREEQILRSLARGKLYKEIADEHGISFHTVRKHVQTIYRKLQVNSRAGAVKAISSRP